MSGEVSQYNSREQFLEDLEYFLSKFERASTKQSAERYGQQAKMLLEHYVIQQQEKKIDEAYVHQ